MNADEKRPPLPAAFKLDKSGQRNATNVSKKTRYSKSEAVKALEELATNEAKRLHPNTPERFIARREFTDKTSGGLTSCIIQYIRLMGGAAERINSTGRQIDTRTTFEDVTGRQRTIGGTHWIKNNGCNGSADVSGILPGGKSIRVEVKIGRDIQSEAQKQYQAAVQQAGGLYVIARDFTTFLAWYESKFQKP